MECSYDFFIASDHWNRNSDFGKLLYGIFFYQAGDVEKKNLVSFCGSYDVFLSRNDTDLFKLENAWTCKYILDLCNSKYVECL